MKKKLGWITGLWVIFMFWIWQAKMIPLNPGILLVYDEIANGSQVYLSFQAPSLDGQQEQRVLTSYATDQENEFLLDSEGATLSQAKLYIPKSEDHHLQRLALYSQITPYHKRVLAQYSFDQLIEDHRIVMGKKSSKGPNPNSDALYDTYIFSESFVKELKDKMSKQSPVKDVIYVFIIVSYFIYLGYFLWQKYIRWHFGYYIAHVVLLVSLILVSITIMEKPPLSVPEQGSSLTLSPTQVEWLPLTEDYEQIIHVNHQNMNGIDLRLEANFPQELPAENTVILVELLSLNQKVLETQILERKDLEYDADDPYTHFYFSHAKLDPGDYILRLTTISGEGSYVFIGASDQDILQRQGLDEEVAKTIIYEVCYAVFPYRSVAIICIWLGYLFVIFSFWVHEKKSNARVYYGILYSLALTISIAQGYFYRHFVRGMPDEAAHISYVAYFSKYKKLWIPEFSKIPLGILDSTTDIWTASPNTTNYLGHPMLYYKLMAVLLQNPVLASGEVFIRSERFLKIQWSLFIITLLFIFYICYRYLPKKPLWQLLGVTIILNIPMFLYSLISIGNDGLTILTVLLFFIGLLRVTQQKYNLVTFLLIALGICSSVLVKMTAGIFVVLTSIVFLMIYHRRYHLKQLFKHPSFWYVMPIYGLTALYFILTYMKNGMIQGSYEVLDPEGFYHSVFYRPIGQRISYSIFQYLNYFMSHFFSSWTGLSNEYAVLKQSSWYSITRLPMILVLVVPFFWWRPKMTSHKLSMIMRSVTLVLCIEWFLQIKNAIYGFYMNGYLGGFQSRYYLFAVPILSYGIVIYIYEWQKNRQKTQRMDSDILVASLTALWIFLLMMMNFVYFLVHFNHYLI